jgi:structural maintenance of chromosome 3 (chondroitin sulfate proteoglycan 6)
LNSAKINEVLEYIDTRLSELQGEKEELTEYQRLDRRRRAMEYTLYEKELRKAREQLDNIEHERNEEVEKLSHMHDQAHQIHDQIRSIETRMKQIANKMRRTRNLIGRTNKSTAKSSKAGGDTSTPGAGAGGAGGLEAEHLTAVTRKTKLELEVKELEESLSADVKMKAQLLADFKDLEAQIASTQHELDQVALPKFTQAKEVMDRLSKEKSDAAQKVQALYAKQGRGRQFRTQKERDGYLKKQIQEIDESLPTKKQELDQWQDKIAGLRRAVTTEDDKVVAKQADATKKSELLEKLQEAIQEKTRNRNELDEQRRISWRQLEEVSEKVSEAREKQKQCASDVRKSMPKATQMGVEALKGIVAREKIPPHKYLGSVVENLQLKDPKFQTAVEVAAQNSLFHVIVDTDETAAHLMTQLERRKLGRVTFLPLNQLHVDDRADQYPQSTDCAPLLDRCVTYEPRVEKAMKHVFGKKILARSNDAALMFSKSHNMDAITLDGDLCSRKGALSGGYVDESRSKLKAFYASKEAEAELTELEGTEREKRKKETAVGQQITSLLGELTRLEGKQKSLEQLLDQIRRDVQSSTKRNQNRQTQIDNGTNLMTQLSEQYDTLGQNKQALVEEMGTALSDQLSESERDLLANLNNASKELTSNVSAQRTVLEEASLEKDRLSNMLNGNLLKRKAELEDAIESVSSSSSGANRDSGVFSPSRNSNSRSSGGNTTTAAHRKRQLELRVSELDEVERQVQDAERRLAEAQAEEEKHRQELIGQKAQLEDAKTKDNACAQALEEAKEKAERLLNKVSV